MNTQYHHGDLKNALIQAGIEILSKEGVEALSLRSVAKRVGVSHSAPYAHFADKQALIAAIAAQGYRKLYARLVEVHYRPDDPLHRLEETAFAYLQFALDEPDYFKVTFAGAVEAEKNYPEYVEQSQRCYGLVVELVKDCHAQGLFASENIQLLAVSIWSCLHGFVQLLLSNQFPSVLTSQYPIREIFRFHLQQILPLGNSSDAQART